MPELDDGLDDLDLEVAQGRRARAEQSLRDAFAQSPAILVRSGDREELWILSGETNPAEGKVRVTELWTDGPGGHLSAQSVEDLVRRKAEPWESYEPVDEDFVVAWTSTDEWREGIKRVAYVQAYNQLMWIAGQADAYQWAWDRAMQAKQMDDIEQATRALEQAAGDLRAGRAPNAASIRKLKRRLLAR